MKGVKPEMDIDELLDRGVENIFPSRDFLKAKLLKGEKITLYLGIDPTGPTLHMGHVIPLIKLRKFQEMGHQIILLMGDFTAMIGDPTDKGAARIKLTHQEVIKNLQEYKKQASKFISFDGANKALFKFNSKWLAKMTFEDVLELASLVTVDQMLKRDMFAKRQSEGKPIFIHEFMYPLMQGYDSVAMNVDGEIGGNDQTFNMLVGRDLVKTLQDREKFVLATKLLVDSSGKKMGKTENNMVSLDQNSGEMFGRVMSWADTLIIPGFELITDVPMFEIETMKKEMEDGANPKYFKMRLAHAVVRMYHGEKYASSAEANFNATFSKKEIPENIEELEGEGPLAQVLSRSGLFGSNSEIRRLFDAGAIADLTDDKKLSSSDIAMAGHVYKIGKHRFVKIN